MACPIRKALGLIPGLAAIKAATVVLNLMAIEYNVSPALMTYAVNPVGHVAGGVMAGTQMIWPMNRALGLIPGLACRSIVTVVLNLTAIEYNVSPALMTYAVNPVGHVAGGVMAGTQMVWPINRALGLIPGFAAIKAATVVLNLMAIEYNVSPALMTYVVNPVGHVAGGVMAGTQMIWPMNRALGLIPGLAAIKAATVVLNLMAIEYNVSPALMTYAVNPVGHVAGGGVTAGTQMVWPINRAFGLIPGLACRSIVTVVLNLIARL